MERCENEGKLNPYQPDRTPLWPPCTATLGGNFEREVKNLKSIEVVSFEDISSEEEIDHYERVEGSELREETSDLGATPEDQTDYMSKHILGNHPYIIEEESWSENRLLHDFLNMEQQLHWRALLACKMVHDKKSW